MEARAGPLFEGCEFEPSVGLRVVSLSKILYSNLLLSTQVYKWVPAEAGKVTGPLYRGLKTLSQQHYKLRNLAHSLVKRIWAPLDALKSVLPN